MVHAGRIREAQARIRAVGASPDAWPRALEAVARALRAANVTLEIFPHGRSTPVFFRAHGVPPAAEQTYLAQFASLNPRAGYCGRLRTGQIASDYDFLSDAIMDRDPYYADFLAPQGLRCFGVGVLERTRHEQRVVVANRSLREGPADAALLDGLRLLVPALCDALDTTTRLGEALGAAADMTAALDWLTDGVATIDRDGALLHLNAALAEMIRADDGLRVVRRVLEPADMRARRRLGDAVGHVLRGETGGSVLVPRPSGARPYLITLRPAPAEGDRTPYRARAFLFVTDTARARATTAEILIDAFGLTDAEVQLALALHEGRSPLEHARARGISDNTVYTHLRRLKQKTGTHRVAELIARIDAVRTQARGV